MEEDGWVHEIVTKHRILDDSSWDTKETRCQARNRQSGLMAEAAILKHKQPDSNGARQILGGLLKCIHPFLTWRHNHIGQVLTPRQCNVHLPLELVSCFHAIAFKKQPTLRFENPA